MRKSVPTTPYKLWLEPEVHSGREQLPGKIRQRIKHALDRLAADPRPSNSRILDLTGLDLPPHIELRRLRLEDWRVIYAINDQEKWTWVLGLHRRPPYNYQDLEEIVSKLDE